ncbi:helix-turn-helix transcriptional regulator [Nocardioides psychrotolerans]|uniref:helix-turn-helix transcriptional regulator n=1 Tax=Nocardioides psychrotolerans TaxID=1005945 RepID=UPI0031377F31
MTAPPSPATPRVDLLGRDDLLVVLESALGKTGVRALHARGLPGSGRTRWLEEVAERSALIGRRVVRAGGVRAEQELALSTAYDVLVALGSSPGVASRLSTRRASLRLTRALEKALASQPTTLVLDDVHDLDVLSGSVVHRALRALAGEPDADVLLATAGDLDTVHDPWREDDTLLLGPMTDAHLGALVSGVARTSVRPRAVRRIVTLAEGSPRSTVELVSTLAPDGTLPDAPTALHRRQLEAFARLGPQPRRLVLLAALAEGDRRIARLASAADLAPAAVREHLEGPARLLGLSVTTQVGFHAPRLAAAVLATSPAEEVAALRRDLLPSAPPAERLAHRAHLAVGPDDAVAAELLRAAREQLRQGLLDRAVGTATLAGAAALSPTLSVDATLVEVEATLGLGQVDVASVVLRETEPVTPRQRAAATVLRFMAEFELLQTGARYLLEEAKIIAAPYADLGAELAVWETYLRSLDRDFVGMAEPAARALALAGASRDQAVVAMAVGTREIAALLAGSPVDLDGLRSRVAGCDPDQARHPVLDPHFMLTTCLWSTGQLVEARQLAAERAARSVDRGDLSFGAQHVVVAYLCARATGELHGLEGLLDTVERRARDYGHETADAVSLLLGYVRALDRDDTLTEAFLEPAVVELATDGSGSQSTILTIFGEAMGDGWIATGRAAQALHLMRGFAEQVVASPVGEPGFLHPVVTAAEAAVTVGDPADARRWLDVVLTHPLLPERPHVHGPALRVHALCLAAEGDLEAASTAAAAAVDVARQAGLRGHEGRALLSLAVVLRRSRQRRRATAALDDAVRLLETCGLLSWRDRALDERDRAAARPGPRDGRGLSAAQTRVAGLAAGGASNAEIAALLGLSPRTVESHLAASYRKLGIRRRGQLAGALDAALDAAAEAQFGISTDAGQAIPSPD